MPLTVDSMRAAIIAIDAALRTQAERLNELDGNVGDGDLGVTLEKAFRVLADNSANLRPELGPAMQQAAADVAKVSSSSFGTLLASSLLAAGKRAGNRKDVPWPEVGEFLQAALDKMRERGGAAIGDKTVLDAVNAAIVAVSDKREPAVMLVAARENVATALKDLRNQPNRMGRARVYGERSIGADDPGMVAFQVMLEALPEPLR